MSADKTHTYKLYMWISDEISVGNIDGADYNVIDWSNLYASIKLSNGRM